MTCQLVCSQLTHFGTQMPSGIQGPFKGMVSFGQLVGQLTFGFLGDGMSTMQEISGWLINMLY